MLSEHRLVALVYPTLRRKPARIGDAQGASNCQLSAHSGLPALGVPAGFTDDGLPVGLDLLGAAFKEQELLSLGYAIEQTLHLRRPPFSTPALVAGKRPAPRTTTAMFAGTALKLTTTRPTSRLQYTLASAAAVDRLAALWIHLGTADKPGAARTSCSGGAADDRQRSRSRGGSQSDLADGTPDGALLRATAAAVGRRADWLRPGESR